MRLVLMRHAQAADGSPDHSRRLSQRGRDQAKERGKQLAREQFDLALVSDAARTMETFLTLGLDVPEVRYDAELYFGSHHTIVDLVRTMPAELSTVLIIGHEPTVSHAASILAAQSQRVVEVRPGVSTSTAIVIDFDRWDGPGQITDIYRS